MRAKQKRNPNFTETEIQTLLSEVEKHKDILFSKLSNVSTNSAKKKRWESICNKVNAGNADHKRTVDEIRKKWTTYMSNTKKKAARNRREAKKTGGGPSVYEDLTPLEDQVVGIIGETPIEGIDGGTDTGDITADSPVQISKQCSTSRSLQQISDGSDDNNDAVSPDVVNRSSSTTPNIQFGSKRKLTTALPEQDRTNEYTNQLLDTEKSRLSVEKERLAIEKEVLELKKAKTDLLKERNRVENDNMNVLKERLEVEKERRDLERQRLMLEQAQARFQLAQLGMTLNLPAQQPNINQ